MSSSTELTEPLVKALHRHPRRVMTATELAAKVRPLSAEQVTKAIGELRARGVVVTHRAGSPDPHLPAIEAVALVDGDPDDPDALAKARHRAGECVQVLQRQLLRAHRCL